MKIMAKYAVAVFILTLFVSTAGQAQQQFTTGNSAGVQSDEVPRFELGVVFSGIHLSENNNFGLGGRAVFNVNSVLSFEGEGNYFLNNATPGFLSGGRAVEGLFGAKVGFRNDAVGIFAKVRPGFISFSDTVQGITFNPTLPSAFSFQTGQLTEPALDLGTVIEFYPARHWAWRTDVGDTMIFYHSISVFGAKLPGGRQNNFQFSTGLQYRF